MPKKSNNQSLKHSLVSYNNSIRLLLDKYRHQILFVIVSLLYLCITISAGVMCWKFLDNPFERAGFLVIITLVSIVSILLIFPHHKQATSHEQNKTPAVQMHEYLTPPTSLKDFADILRSSSAILMFVVTLSAAVASIKNFARTQEINADVMLSGYIDKLQGIHHDRFMLKKDLDDIDARATLLNSEDHKVKIADHNKKLLELLLVDQNIVVLLNNTKSPAIRGIVDSYFASVIKKDCESLKFVLKDQSLLPFLCRYCTLQVNQP